MSNMQWATCNEQYAMGKEREVWGNGVGVWQVKKEIIIKKISFMEAGRKTWGENQNYENQ